MGVTATVPILPGAAVNQERSYASYPQSRRRGSSGTVVATRLSTSGLSPRETLLSHAPQARLTAQITGGEKHSEERAALFDVRVNLPCYVLHTFIDKTKFGTFSKGNASSSALIICLVSVTNCSAYLTSHKVSHLSAGHFLFATSIQIVPFLSS